MDGFRFGIRGHPVTFFMLHVEGPYMYGFRLNGCTAGCTPNHRSFNKCTRLDASCTRRRLASSSHVCYATRLCYEASSRLIGVKHIACTKLAQVVFVSSESNASGGAMQPVALAAKRLTASSEMPLTRPCAEAWSG